MEGGISGDRYLWFPNPSLSPPLRIILDYVVTTRVTPSNRVRFPPRVFGSSFTTVLKLGTNRRGFDWSESRNQWIYRISRKFPIFGKKHEFLPSFSFIPHAWYFSSLLPFFSDAKGRGSSSHVREKKFIKRGRRSHYPPPSLLVGASYHIESNLLIRPPARRDFARRLT